MEKLGYDRSCIVFSSRKKDLKISSLGRKREREKERVEIASFGRIVKV